MKIVLLVLVTLSLLVFVDGNYASILAEQLNQYCETRSCPASTNQQTQRTVAKAGPRGFPGNVGPPGIVNYTLVDELITKRLKDFAKSTTKDCTMVINEFAKTWNETGGVFDIYPGSSGRSMEVYCDVTTDGGGWTVFQRRMDGSEDFFRNWEDYKNGFGENDKEFWLGLEKVHRLTSRGSYELRVDMEDWEGNTAYAQYTTFSIGNAASKYQLNIGGYSGTAGDSLTYHNGRSFYTKDADTNNCANKHIGAWWYGSCYHSSLNGKYIQGGIYTGKHIGTMWYYWKNTHFDSLKRVEMKFRLSF